MTRSLIPQKLRVRGRSISAPRYTSSAMISVPVCSQRWTMRAMASSERNAAGRVVGIREVEQACRGRHGALELVPSPAPSPHPAGAGTAARSRRGCARRRHLHVVRQLHRDGVAGTELAQRDQIVRFRRAVGDLDVIDRRAGISAAMTARGARSCRSTGCSRAAGRGRPRDRTPSRRSSRSVCGRTPLSLMS